LDHLVVAARRLEEGARWVEERLGVASVAGGKHPLMGTHNRLLSLGRRRYLEIISIDPEAPPPGRARWFDLDSPTLGAALERGPALIHWVERTDDIERDLRGVAGMEILSASRGPYRWRIGVPRDGTRPAGGARPTLIQWEGGRHPAADLPASGCELLAFEATPCGLSATFSTPLGISRIS
jgi:hypothetical protein